MATKYECHAIDAQTQTCTSWVATESSSLSDLTPEEVTALTWEIIFCLSLAFCFRQLRVLISGSR